MTTDLDLQKTSDSNFDSVLELSGQRHLTLSAASFFQ